MESDANYRLQEDYEPLIVKLRSTAKTLTVIQPDISSLLLEAADTIQSMGDLSIYLVDDDGNEIYRIPDTMVRSILIKAINEFLLDMTGEADATD